LSILFIAICILNANIVWAQKTYYIDSKNGDDNYNGLSINTAWKSHTMVSTVTFQPGDTIAFKKGSQFTGPIQFTESGTEQNPITITSYGEGELPRFTNPNDEDLNGNCIRISGSWIILEGLYFHDTPPINMQENDRLRIFKTGAVVNWHGAQHNIIRNNKIINCTQGIQSNAEYTLITKNYIDGPDKALWDAPEDVFDGWGPIGIHLCIGNQEVCYNIIKNNLTENSPFGQDGGAIEIDDGRYHKDNIYIHHNYTEGNAGFIESSWGWDYNPYVQEDHHLIVAFNICVDEQDWLLMWAPCHDCYFDNNTVIRTSTRYGSDVVDIPFPGIQFRNNLIIYTNYVYRFNGAKGIITDNNWYFKENDPGAVHWDTHQAGSGDPGLVDLENGDYHLKSDSPLRGKGSNLSEYYTVDYDGKPLPKNGAWDIGAFQFPELSPYIIKNFKLRQNYPNPFNTSTIINFIIPRTDNVTMAVYNLVGQKIRTLLKNKIGAGNHFVRWNGKDNKGNMASSGIYFYRLESGNCIETKKMMLIH